ncbi:MAG: hypothetical protein AAB426_08760 [Myxococcota bacterium]
MIPGYNHNVKYKERVYHVQTEDSGVANPHVITHLFVGGNIIESRKTSYADISKSDRLSELLVEIMQAQHKTMLKELIAGSLDAKIAERSAGAATLNGPAPLNVDAGAQQRTSFMVGPSAASPAGTTARPLAPPPAPARPRPTSPPAFTAPPPPAPRAPAGDVVSSFFGSAQPAGPIIEAETLQKAFDSRNESAVDSLFGEDLISEKSLDEVILSYLAEDLLDK